MSAEAGAAESGATEFTPITSQEDLNKVIGERIRRAKPADYDELKAKADKFAEWEQSQKTDTQRLQDQLASLTTERDATARKAQRLEVIATEGIPAEYHDLVHGETAEALSASAQKVKAILAKSSGDGKPGVSYRVNLDGDGSETLALNGSGIEEALKSKLGIK